MKNTIYAVEISGLFGVRQYPMTKEAFDQIGEFHSAQAIWKRLLEAQRDVIQNEKRMKSHDYIRAHAKVTVLAQVLADLFGKAAFFYELEAHRSCMAPVGEWKEAPTEA